MKTHIAEIVLKLESSRQEVQTREVVSYLSFGARGNTPVLYALVDMESPLRKVSFMVLLTGDEAPSNAARRYLGSATLVDERWHPISAHLFHCDRISL